MSFTRISPNALHIIYENKLLIVVDACNVKLNVEECRKIGNNKVTDTELSSVVLPTSNSLDFLNTLDDIEDCVLSDNQGNHYNEYI